MCQPVYHFLQFLGLLCLYDIVVFLLGLGPQPLEFWLLEYCMELIDRRMVLGSVSVLIENPNPQSRKGEKKEEAAKALCTKFPQRYHQ